MNDTQLLVSVRSAEEALAALAGGADVIDVKEPARGSLGRADAQVIRQVAMAIAGRASVSAALGEWTDGDHEIPDAGLMYVKWGLARCARRSHWSRELRQLLARQRSPQPVLVAYADWECAQAPSIDDVFALAADHPGCVMLVDTHCKDANGKNPRPTLLDWVSVNRLEDLCGQAREARVRIALAGSLGIEEIRVLLLACPDWFAVRGAVCDAGDRQAGVREDKVRQLASLISSAS